jgi:hypothetical protein
MYDFATLVASWGLTLRKKICRGALQPAARAGSGLCTAWGEQPQLQGNAADDLVLLVGMSVLWSTAGLNCLLLQELRHMLEQQAASAAASLAVERDTAAAQASNSAAAAVAAAQSTAAAVVADMHHTAAGLEQKLLETEQHRDQLQEEVGSHGMRGAAVAHAVHVADCCWAAKRRRQGHTQATKCAWCAAQVAAARMPLACPITQVQCCTAVLWCCRWTCCKLRSVT